MAVATQQTATSEELETLETQTIILQTVIGDENGVDCIFFEIEEQ